MHTEETSQIIAEAPEPTITETAESSSVIHEEQAPISEEIDLKPQRKGKPRKKVSTVAAASEVSTVGHGRLDSKEDISSTGDNSPVKEPDTPEEKELKPKRSRSRKKKEPITEPET